MYFLTKKLYFFMILSISQNFFLEIASKGIFRLAKIGRVIYNI